MMAAATAWASWSSPAAAAGSDTSSSTKARKRAATVYLFTASDDPAPCVYSNGSHVRVVVGVVVVAPDDVRPVYLDPMWDEVQVKVLRKHHLSRAPAYELLYLE